MTEESIEMPELQTAILTVYRGLPEEFVRRRDALAKELRSSGRRADADQVKALRKPSRTAWTLNRVAVEEATHIEHLTAAITAAQEASAGGADLRAALENVRSAVRDVAAAAARAAVRAGHPIDSTSLVSALNALIGDANALGELRAGRLVEIPEAGRLDFLSAVASTNPPSPARIEPSAQPEPQDAAAIRARGDLQRTEKALSEARERSEAAERAVLEAQAKLEAAEQQLQRAKEESAKRRAELDRTRVHAESAASQLEEAERAVVDHRARVKQLSKHNSNPN
jgi:hypothetical protein